MITVIPCEPPHILEIHASRPFKFVGDDPLKFAELVCRSGTAFSGMKDGKIIGAAGVQSLHAGVGRAWALLTPEVLAHRFFLHRAVRRKLPQIFRAGNFHRIEALVLRGFGPGCAWAVSLGFKMEGIMLKYDSEKQDYYLYSLTT